MVYTSPFDGPTIDTANDMRPYARVLRKFPRLTLILGHGGYPRVRQTIEAARDC
jgi:predicted TIM-barrel fold metal-dependent hydrolase